MAEAVRGARDRFAAPGRGAYPQPRQASEPHHTMDNPHPTSRPPRRHGSLRRPIPMGRRCTLALAGALSALVLLVAAAPASAYTTQYSFTVTGHGWGHGIGLSQWGAYGYAKHGWKYKAILKHYYSGISFIDAGNPIVRVNLRSDKSAYEVTCANAYTAAGGGAEVSIPAGTTAKTTYSGGAYHVVAGSVSQDFSSAVTFTASSGLMKLLTKTDLGDDGAYRGVVRIARVDAKLMMINHVPLESYLRGVVPHEVSYSWPVEALKTQACAARAYSLASLQPSKGWDVYCDVRDQAYAGAGIEKDQTDAAVKATAGVTPSYGGKAISAFYFSCSGGRTENIEHAWPGASKIAYLKGVADPYDKYASLHDWGPLKRTPSQLGKPLGAKGSLRAVYTVKRGTSPRIVKAAVIGSDGTKYVDGNTIRAKLGLNSTWAIFTSMSISPAARDDASVAAGAGITLKGRIYPALAEGASVYLNAYYSGKWHRSAVATTAASESLPNGYTAKYSTYGKSVKPGVTTKYYFSSGKAKSPTTTVAVN